MQQAVCGSIGEGGVLNVFAEDAGALLFAASEKVPTGVMVGVRAGMQILLMIGIV
jgi:hypothetical protein